MIKNVFLACVTVCLMLGIVLTERVAYADGELVGNAYAVLDDNGTLTFFRSENDYPNGDGLTVTDIIGNTYTGRVFTDFENASAYTSVSQVPWSSYRASIMSVTVADNQVIKPVATAYWFYLCTNLGIFDGSGFDVSSVTNMNRMFYYCQGSSFNPDMSDWDTSSVTNMDGMFMGCSGSNFNPNVFDWDVSNVTNMSSMFNQCSGVNFNPNVSNWNTSNVTSMMNMFGYCYGSSFNPNVSNWNTSSVTDMSAVFYECRGSSFNVDVSNWDTSNVTDMSYMFYNCSGNSFTNLDVSGWNFDKITDSSKYLGLQRCSKLRTLVVSDTTKINTDFPNHSVQGIYTDKWRNDYLDLVDYTSSNMVALINSGQGEGTWEWDLRPSTTFIFYANGGTGTMERQVILSGRSDMLHGSQFSLFDHDFVSWNTEPDGSGITYQAGQVVTSSATTVERIRLYAQWQQKNHTKTLTDGGFDVKVPAGYRLVIDDLPGNAGYVINEVTPSNWELDTELNSSGNIPSNSSAIASFNNVWTPGSCSVRFVGTKSMDNAGADANAFRFRLWEGNVLVEEVSNAAGGMIAFTPMTYTDDDTGLHQYRIEEVIGDNSTIDYDTHVENISVNVTGSSDSLSADVTYDADGIRFENKTVPGSLLLRKVIQNATNASEDDEFDLGVRLLTPDGSSLGDVSIQTRDAA